MLLDALNQDCLSQMLLFSSAFIIPSFNDNRKFQMCQTVVRSRSFKFYNPAEDRRIVVVVAKQHQRSTSTLVTYKVIAVADKTISAATVLPLRMNGLYIYITRVCVPLSAESERGNIKLLPASCELYCV